jgi:segregation and condensation protein B
MADSKREDDLPDEEDGEEFLPAEHFERDDAPRQESSDEAFSGNDLSTDDLEAAYLRALEAMETEEWAIDSESDDSESIEAAEEPDQSPIYGIDHTVPIDVNAISNGGADFPELVANDRQSTAMQVAAETDRGSSIATAEEMEIAEVDFLSGPGVRVSTEQDQSAPVTSASAASSKSSGPVSPQILTGGSTRATDAAQPPPNATRIIEACLFVGGQPLSAKRLATLLESTGEPSYLERLIDELNLEYASQQRPYEIRLGDGGYRMALRTEFEAVRNRVYGVGPRDVKLSQDVLEVLALVAYQQPITHAAVEGCGKVNVANILRQLLRRELITLTRIDQTRNGVEYRTSGRFLQLFGLGNLNELPRPEDLAMR